MTDSRDVFGPSYPAHPVLKLKRSEQQAMPNPSDTFKCAVCDDGLRVCTCPWGHHNAPIRDAIGPLPEEDRT